LKSFFKSKNRLLSWSFWILASRTWCL